MRLFQSFALVSCFITLSACAAEPTEEDTGETSDAIANTRPVKGFVTARAEQFRVPDLDLVSTPANKLGSVNEQTRLVAYCTTDNADGKWLGSSLRTDWAMSYAKIWPSTLQGCFNTSNVAVSCTDFLRNLPPCGPTTGATNGSGSSSGSVTPPPALVAIERVPAGARVLLTRRPSGASYFNETISVQRSGNGTFSVGGVWTAYGADNLPRRSQRCVATDVTFPANATGNLDCTGSASGATRFEITYYAHGAGVASARLY